MAKEELNVASLNPDDMSKGLKSDFEGTVTEATYCEWDYEGNIDTPVLACRLTIEDPDDEDPYVQHWSAGSLEHFKPSENGKKASEEGPYAIRAGKKNQLNSNTNFGHLLESILDAGKASKKFTTDDLTPSLECLVGLRAHWDRVPQKKRSGMTPEDNGAEGGGGGRGRDILVCTEVLGYRDEKKASKTTAKAKAVTSGKKAKEPEPEEEEATSELDETLQAAIVEAITDAGGTLKKGKIATLVLKAFAKEPKLKSEAVKRCTQADFLEAGPWAYDEDEGTLTIE